MADRRDNGHKRVALLYAATNPARCAIKQAGPIAASPPPTSQFLIFVYHEGIEVDKSAKQHVALATLSQVVAKLRMTTQLILA